MIKVCSFLRASDGSFVDVEECEVRPPDAQYVEGAIELTVDEVPVISIGQWDYVDQLWSYIAEMIRSIAVKPEVSTYFPDQPLILSFKRTSPARLLVECGSRGKFRKVNVDEASLVDALGVAGASFFRKMTKLLPENASGYKVALDALAARRD